jgi:hypothetical protein
VNAALIDVLFAEILRYLELIDLLRREGYEPRWRVERVVGPVRPAIR